ncbi:MAG: hypothetical protein LBG52_07115 [Candidatus Peribacteria bacterium]|jgi:hypothetical protein|nr:hypothetical protein [Candidatus Peribacteria bacterium]
MATKKTSLPKATSKKSSSFAVKANSPMSAKKTVPTKKVALTKTKAEKVAPRTAETKKATSKPVVHPITQKVAEKPVVTPTPPTLTIDPKEELIEKPLLSTKELLAPPLTIAPTVKTKVKDGMFKGYDQVENRIFLSNPKTY